LLFAWRRVASAALLVLAAVLADLIVLGATCLAVSSVCMNKDKFNNIRNEFSGKGKITFQDGINYPANFHFNRV
jgi:hypothetical protein